MGAAFPFFFFRPKLTLTLLVWLATTHCHDAPRNNPFDPELTPGVSLNTVVLDAIAGSVSLVWTPYAGRQAFSHYRLLRKEQGLEAVDQIAEIADPQQTSYSDTTIAADKDYLYWIEVVNQAGFAAPSTQVSLRSFSVRGVDLLPPVADNVTGTITLRWRQYIGPDFERYQLHRRRLGQDPILLATLTTVSDTLWQDAPPLPGIDYLYSVTTLAADLQLSSGQREARYDLPDITLESLVFSSTDATARLRWSPYNGPHFVAYQIRRSVPGQSEIQRARLADLNTTGFTDSTLDGNTAYSYRVFVETSLATGQGATSQTETGSFYALQTVEPLPAVNNAHIQGVGLAVDAADQLYLAASVISTTTAQVMLSGLRILYPGENRYQIRFINAIPDERSPVHLAIGEELLFTAFKTTDGDILVGAINADRREAWQSLISAGDTFPRGLIAEPDGSVLMVNDNALVYRLVADDAGDVVVEINEALRSTLENDQATPLRYLVIARGTGPGGNDQFIVLAHERPGNQLLGRIRLDSIFGGRALFYDDGVGLENGQTLSPRVIAFDPSRTRLVVIDDLGRLQVLDASFSETEQRYITKWGGFGSGNGEFRMLPPTAIAVAVNSQGLIHVADGAGTTGRIQIFAP